MFPSSFAYHRATSVADAVQILAANPAAKILAGGYSLIPAMKLRLAMPEVLVDLGKLSELKAISIEEGQIRIGAMVTYDAIRDNAELVARFPVFPEAILYIGDQQVRAHGTLGGALAHNDPAADLTAVFLALDGSVSVTGANGARTIASDELFVDLWTTTLEPDEIITEISLPTPAAGTVMAYKKYGHPASGYALAGVAAVVAVENGLVTSARIGVTGATSTSTRATAAEESLIGQPLDDASIAADAALVPDGLEINGDTFADAEYRTHLLTVLGRDVLKHAISR
ncbi:MAG TPA: xanthine dehydrogenase family protein subunit M [Thermomicrobiales bacterium]|nr:xanthine dehydrogenase family protein subunit M [Thermomicrobiales bacterium]